MSADLHIHVGPMPIVPADHPVKIMLNGPWELDHERFDELKARGEIEDIWIGEVSWLKAGLFGDSASFIPPLVAAISETFHSVYKGQPVKITPAIIELVKERIAASADVEDRTSYSIADPEAILIWLTQQMGREAWTVSW